MSWKWSSTKKCVKVKHDDEVVHDKKVKMEAPQQHNDEAGLETPSQDSPKATDAVTDPEQEDMGNKTMQGAATTSNAAGHTEVNQMHESEAAIVKDMANDETAYSDKVGLKAPKGGGSVNTYTKMAHSKPEQNLCGAHTARGGYKWNHPVRDRVWHNPANMISLEECPNTGDHNAMEYD